MPRIPYVDFTSVADPEIRGYLDRARREGTPRPESQAGRAHNPNVIRCFPEAWDLDFPNGLRQPPLKGPFPVFVPNNNRSEAIMRG